MMKTGAYAEFSAGPNLADRGDLIHLLPDALLLISP